MSRSAFSNAYKEITNLEPMEMTFTIEDADLDKLHDVLININVRECPWFEVQDKHGNKAKYHREPHWIPCSERLPELDDEVLVTDDNGELRHCIFCTLGETWCGFITYEEGMRIIATAWMPLPEPWKGEEE